MLEEELPGVARAIQDPFAAPAAPARRRRRKREARSIELRSVTAIIVNYRSSALTIDCLASLEPEARALPALKVVVVENASGDGSEEMLRKTIGERGWSAWAELIAAGDNRGFAAGNNVALQHCLRGPAKALPDYVLLLNPDTVLRTHAVRELLGFMEAHPEVGIAGSRLEDPDGTQQQSQFRFPGPLSEFEAFVRTGPFTKLLKNRIVRLPLFQDVHPVDWLAGASMMIRREVFEAVGLFDERYFLYYEETDFCLRAQRAGWDTWYVPQSRVVHLVGGTTGVTIRERRPARRPTYWFASRRRYFVKNHGVVCAALADLAAIAGLAMWRVRRALQRIPDRDPPRLLTDLIRNSVFLKGAR
ncbi:MAG: glycosyltransferase family 2 protein [Planctomycetes bacterium]|nr:glycosyltransferase family 2 protein [Planctomycetota bacterium]